MNRRTFLGCCCALCVTPAFAADDGGCWKTGAEADQLLEDVSGYASYGNGIQPSSGNELLDVAFAHALTVLSNDFEVYPGVGFKDVQGAWATYKNEMHHKDGTVVWGLSFLKHFLAKPQYPGAYVVAVTAHEFGHIVQWKRGIHDSLAKSAIKPMELHADYLSGWFAGRRKLKNSWYPAQIFAESAHDYGSYDYDNPKFHGTPDERGNAVQAGFLAAARDKLPLAQAVEAGITYVTGRPSTPSKTFQQAPVTSYR